MNSNKNYISAAEFGANPNNENNATELRNAVIACRAQKGLTLVIPPGIYHFRDEEAIEMRETVMTGKLGSGFERMMFFPYAPYVKGLDFSGCENLTVQAEGVTLLCHGWMEPLSLENCKNITINGIVIDYSPKPFSVGKIVERNEKYFDIEIDPAYPITPETPFSRTSFWNATENRLVRSLLWPVKKSIGSQKVRFEGPAPNEKGEILTMSTHTLHFRPAILMNEAENITLNHVTVHSQPGMGIVGNRTHNITLNYFRVIPSVGIHMSTNTDATHFTACTGTILFDHCHIEGQPDDSTNIHCYYQSIVNIVKEAPNEVTVKLRVDAPTGTHAQVLDHPDIGNEMELVEIETLRTLKTFRVVDVKCFPEQWFCEVTIQGQLPPDFQKYYLVDITRIPKVIIRNCHFYNTLTRVLLKSRNAIIENNVFENVGTGVFCGAEEGWKEGHTVGDIIIRNNRFINCSEAISINLNAKNTSIVGINKRFTIENNIIEGGPGMNGIFIGNSEEVVIQNNLIKGIQPGIRIQQSKKIKMTQNTDCKIELGADVSEFILNKGEK